MKPFDRSGAFRPVAADENLRSIAVRGAGTTILFQGISLGVQMTATVVLARLLTPADFGLVAIATTVSLLFLNCGLNGFTEAIIQRADINHKLASNIFWLSITISFLLTLVVAASGTWLAQWYHEPSLVHVMEGVAPTILLTGASVLHLALLKRAMRFTMVSSLDLFGRSVLVVTSILLGLAGWSYWALIAGLLAQALTVMLGAWILCRWTPGPPRRVAGTGEVIRFAINVYGFFGVNYIKGNMDNVLVGWRLGSHVLGLYKKAFDLFSLPASLLLGPMSTAAVPAMCRLTDDPERRRRYLLRTFSILALVGMGLSGCLTLGGRDLLLVLLGPKWVEAGNIVPLFGPGVGAMILYAPWAWICLSIGRADRYLRWGMIELVVTGVLILLVLPWGPRAVAAAWSLAFWILMMPATWYAGKPIGFGIGPVIQVVWRYILAALLGAFACAAITREFTAAATLPGVPGAIARIAMTCSIFGTLYFGITVVLHGGWEPIHQIRNLLPDLSPGRLVRSSGSN